MNIHFKKLKFNSEFYIFVSVFLSVFLAFLIYWVGPITQLSFGHDFSVLTDGAWKFINGFLPHRDYYSPQGLLNFAMPALAMKLVGSNVEALSVSHSLWILIATFFAFSVLYKRISPIDHATLILFTAIHVASMKDFGRPPESIAYVSTYNHQGIAFFGIFLMFIFAKNQKSKLQHYLAGTILTICLFLKITYFLFALPIVFLAILIRSLTPRNALSIALGFLGSSLILLIAFQLNPLDYYHDLAIAAHARTSSFKIDTFIEFLYLFPSELVAILGLSFFAFRGSLFSLAVGVGFWLIACLIFVTNPSTYAYQDSPLFIYIYLLLLSLILTQLSAKTSRPALKMLILVLFLNYDPLDDLISIGIGLEETLHPSLNRKFLEFNSKSIEKIKLYGYRGAPPVVGFVEKSNEGIETLKKIAPLNSRILTFDFVNIFPFALGWPPAKGSPLFWHYGFGFNESSAPSAESVFAGADFVLVAKKEGSATYGTVPAWESLYFPYLHKNFEQVYDTPQWYYFKKITLN